MDSERHPALQISDERAHFISRQRTYEEAAVIDDEDPIERKVITHHMLLLQFIVNLMPCTDQLYSDHISVSSSYPTSP